jgi:hypothetical protein
MSDAQVIRMPSRLLGVVMLARLLQRLETSREPVSPEQYRAVVQRLKEALRDTPTDEHLQTLFRIYPAAAEVYENLQYEYAGLLHAPLEVSLNTELQAREVIQRVARGVEPPPA